MNDDRLAQELRRRADSAASRPDWVRRDLLPAVRHEIDARPQRVMTSNWSPRLGVAAVVAALLIMVIAVPRLTPQPPAATPSPTASPPPGPDTILSTADFAAGVASGALADRVVLVAGTVSVPAAAPPFSFPCEPPDGVCGLGVLDGTDPPVYVDSSYKPTTDTPGSGTWAGGDGGRDYHFPSVPIEGVLALRVMSHNHAFFIGVAGQDGAAPVRSVAEAQAIAISTVSLDQVVLVDGWLVDSSWPGEYVSIDCVPRAFPDVDGLPSRYCTLSDFLSSAAPEGCCVPRGKDQLTVQVGAADRFAANLQGHDATYAISPRLYGGGCTAAPPCWLWDVVARLNGPPDVPTSATPTTIECATSSGLPITLTDATGTVAGCRSLDMSFEDLGDTVLVSNRGDLSLLYVELSASRCIRGLDAQFSVATSGYPLLISEGDAVPGCAGPPVSVDLELDLRTDIAASTVTATRGAAPSSTPSPTPSLPLSNVGSDRQEAAGAAFDLSISADRPEYSEGEAIDVSSALRSESDVTVRCLSAPTISLKQLDGDLYFVPGPFVRSCRAAQDLHAGDEFVTGFLPAVRADFDPNPLDPYIRDGKLYLPPGTYRFVATSSLAVGDPGNGNAVRLKASIVIRVSAAGSPIPTPSAMPSASPPIGTRILACDGTEALGDPGITLIDHSGRIGGCSIGQADFVPDKPIEVTTTRLPYQLAATWAVNPGCPADEQLEFWGPIEQPIGLAEFVLQLARQRDARFEPATCGDVLNVRQVQIAFTVNIRPEDILAISVDRSVADGTVSNAAVDGSFDLQLAAPQAPSPNEPVGVTSRLTYHGTDPVTLSGHWRPDFVFTPLTSGPTFDPYGSLLLCPNAQVHLSADEGVSGNLQGPTALDPADPNYAYRQQYAYDGQFRLPAGAYLIYTGVGFVIGSDCSGERVHLQSAIVVEVGLVGSSGLLDFTASP